MRFSAILICSLPIKDHATTSAHCRFFKFIVNAKRKIVHFNVTEHPTTAWMVQQLKNAFPFDSAPKYLIFDRDSIFSVRVKQFIKDMGVIKSCY